MDPKWRNLIVIVVVVVVVVAGIGVYLAQKKSPSSTSSTTCGTALQSKNPLKVDQPEAPDYLDPDTTFSKPGCAFFYYV